MLGNQQMFLTPKDRGGGGRQKRRSFRQATVRSLLRSKTENRMIGGEQNQKYKWKHAFKRTTSDSKRGLIKKKY